MRATRAYCHKISSTNFYSKATEARLQCSADGKQLYFADGETLHTFDLVEDDTGPDLTPRAQTKLDGPIKRIATHGGRLVAVIGSGTQCTLVEIAGTHPRTIANLNSVPTDLALSGDRITLLMPPRADAPQEVVVLNRRSGLVEIAQRPGAGPLRLRPGGEDVVLIVDKRARTVHRVDLTDDCEPGDAPRRPERPGPETPPEDCGCHQPCSCRIPRPDPRRDPDRRRDPSRRPPRDYCRPGDDGIDEGCIQYIAFGAQIIRINLCDPDRPDCRGTLHSRIDRIERIGSAVFAVVERGRMLAELDPDTLSVRGRRFFREGLGVLLSAPAAGQLLSVAPDLSEITLISPQPTPASTALNVSVTGEVSERVIVGTRFTNSSELGPQFALTPRSVLIVPVVAPSQNYDGPGTDVYLNALQTLLTTAPAADEAPLAKIQRYYAEQSFRRQQLTFHVFGATTSDLSDLYTGGPIEIDDEVASYYYDPFVPGGTRALVNIGNSPAEVRFRGNEVVSITATSSVGDPAVGANLFSFDLKFSAGVLGIPLGGAGQTIAFQPTGPNLPISYTDAAGTSPPIVLQPSDLSGPVSIGFTAAAAASSFSAEIDDLRSALQTMLDAADTANDFAPIEVVWTKSDSTLGKIEILFGFAAGGGTAPRLDSFAADTAAREAFFGVPGAGVVFVLGNATVDTTVSSSIQTAESDLAVYLTNVMLLAEAAAFGGDVSGERILGDAKVNVTSSPGGIELEVTLNMSKEHGGAGVAKIDVGNITGADPLNFAGAQPDIGNTVTPDQSNLMKDPAAFAEMLYGRIVKAIDDANGGAPSGGWSVVPQRLASYATVFAFPVAPPPSFDPTAWSVAAPARTVNVEDGEAMRAFVNGFGQNVSDPNGLADPVDVWWGVNFLSFDDTVPLGKLSPLDSNTRTFAHELGHTLRLGDQYGSSKHNGTLAYIGALDLMGSSQANWPHFCAYHKLALGWHDQTTVIERPEVVIERPGLGATVTRRFMLAPTEWWDGTIESALRGAFPSEPDDVPAGAVALCDLNGDGGVLVTMEARAPTAEFSGGMAPSGAAGRVTVFNVLDYGTSGRYGQVLPDAVDLPAEVIDSFLRYRCRIHLLAGSLQAPASGTPATPFDLSNAPGFPTPGLTVTVEQESSMVLDGQSVPAYLCSVEWTRGPEVDVGFADNFAEWQSSDIAIDYTGQFEGDEGVPDGVDPGETEWPLGEPVGVGDRVVVPPTEGTEEPHRVRARVRNWGEETVRDVEVDFYLRVPGGGGDLDQGEPYRTETIEELPPESQFGPSDVYTDWPVRKGQDQHFCWRAQIKQFVTGEGAAARLIINDDNPFNNWAQQNIFEADIVHDSPPEPLETRFSVSNDGPFVEYARLVPRGLPEGVTVRIRPAQLRVPAFASRNFQLRFEFDEAVIEDPCRREMEILMQCMRREDHYEEPWGASLFKFRLRRKTRTTLDCEWPFHLSLSGKVEPPIGVGRVALRLDFENGAPATWLDVALSPGGTYDATFDTTTVNHNNRVVITATYRGSPTYAPSTSDPHTCVLHIAG